jgi:hypothetical protein
MPLNWNDEHIPSKADKTTDIPGFREIGGVGQLVYHPFRFKSYDLNYGRKDSCAFPVCKPGMEPEFPAGDMLTGKRLLISLCNLAKEINSFETTEPKDRLIVKWCMENMHPYSIDFIYSELVENFDINTIDAEMVARDGIFEIETFMKDLGKLYNAVRFYVTLEGILYADDESAYNLYEEGRYFENYNFFERYKHAGPKIPDEILTNEASREELLKDMRTEDKYIREHPAEQPSEGKFDFNHNPFDDYDELMNTLVDFIPDFNMKLKFSPTTKRFEFSADVDSVFDIAWYTLARMISEDPALENRNKQEERPEGILICCRHCGKFLIRKGKHQEFCPSPECQKARKARNQKDFRKRKAAVMSQTESKSEKKTHKII